MNGILLGFEIALGIALFWVVFFVAIPRLSLPVRVWLFTHFRKEQTPPPEMRRYLVRRGIKLLKKVKKLPPEIQKKTAMELMQAALDDKEGVFEGMHSEMIADAMKFLGSIPLECCANCAGPIFTHEAVKINGAYFCDNCAQSEKKI
jgi:formylmethanofuran dehydrogenase subunit E